MMTAPTVTLNLVEGFETRNLVEGFETRNLVEGFEISFD
jgi:hypothetical protein